MLVTVFGFVASGAEFIQVVRHLGPPFLITVGTIAIILGLGPRVQSRLAGWHRHGFYGAICVAATLCVVAYAMTFADQQEDEEFAALTQDRAPLNWANQTIKERSLAESDLKRTIATEATIRQVDMTDADLSGSDLNGATFDRVDLHGAKFCGVDVRGADFRTANGFEDIADFRFFVYDEKTMLPQGVDPSNITGAVETDRPSILYSCEPGVTQLLKLSSGDEDVS